MFENPYLRELEALYREGDDPAHDIIFGDDTSDEWWDRFHAVTKLGLRFLDGQNWDAQKRDEINTLLLFAFSFSSGFPDGRIFACKHPDFRIIQPNRTIGFELRKVYIKGKGKNSMLLQEGLHDKIVSHAHDLYKSKNGPPVCFDFDFACNTDYRESDISRIAQQLINLEPESLANSTESGFIERYNARGPWPEGLVCALGHAPHWWQKENARWEASKGGSVYSSEEFVQAAIDDKEHKLEQYRASGCDECWLLLIVPGFAPSSFMKAPKPKHVFKSSFDRLFYFRLQGTKVAELNCMKP